MKLLIVESPNKVKKINAMLGNDWKVMASVGHVRDLADNDISVDETTYRPKYVFIPARKVPGRDKPFPGGKERVQRIAKYAAQASTVYLATDPDREGEAIAWHLAASMKLANAKRVTFGEITEKAVKTAIANPRTVDMDLVHAQEARRVLDRFYGYKVSRLLSNQAGTKLTAGRVQSPAVLLVVLRERAIRDFEPTTHYTAKLMFEGGWEAEWQTNSILYDEKYCLDQALAQQVADSTSVKVIAFDDTTERKAPPAPFTTSSMQQAASTACKLRPKAAMDAAQKLFEAGVISYHRTDDPNLSDEAFDQIEGFAKAAGLSVNDKRRKWKSKEGSQESHEAIRPTDISVEEAGDNPEEKALYSLIRKRTLAAVLPDAQYAVRKVELQPQNQIEGKAPVFVAKGRKLEKEGWKTIYSDSSDDEEQNDQANPIPALAVENNLTADSGQVVTKKTKAPSRYTEATLVRDMEKRGIGRPSTYAAIMENIGRRQYIEADKKRKLHATDTGEALVDALVGNFEFVDLDFTAELENQLDNVAKGQATYKDVVAKSVTSLEQELKALAATIKPKHSCPQCGQALIRRKGRNGFFWGCSDYPNCKTTAPDDNGKPSQRKPQEVSDKFSCPSCDKPLVHRVKKGKGGYDFWGCSGFPKCKQSFESDSDGNPVFKEKS